MGKKKGSGIVPPRGKFHRQESSSFMDTHDLSVLLPSIPIDLVAHTSNVCCGGERGLQVSWPSAGEHNFRKNSWAYILLTRFLQLSEFPSDCYSGAWTITGWKSRCWFFIFSTLLSWRSWSPDSFSLSVSVGFPDRRNQAPIPIQPNRDTPSTLSSVIEWPRNLLGMSGILRHISLGSLLCACVCTIEILDNKKDKWEFYHMMISCTAYKSTSNPHWATIATAQILFDERHPLEKWRTSAVTTVQEAPGRQYPWVCPCLSFTWDFRQPQSLHWQTDLGSLWPPSSLLRQMTPGASLFLFCSTFT